MKRGYYQSESGSSIVEYAGVLVMGTLLIAGLMAGARQVMPALFSVLNERHESAFSESEPAPAAAAPTPTPAPSSTPTPSPSPTPTPTPEPTPTPSPAPTPAPTPSPSCHGNGKKAC